VMKHKLEVNNNEFNSHMNEQFVELTCLTPKNYSGYDITDDIFYQYVVFTILIMVCFCTGGGNTG